MTQDAHKGIFESFDAGDYRIGIVAALFNAEISNQLSDSALAKCEAYRISQSNITVHRVAGAIEIPVVLKALAETKKYDCLVALGSIIRGETPHFDYVAKIVSEGTLKIMMDYGIPVGFGVLTCENEAQALARLGRNIGRVSEP